ncbi:hypothetical protein PGUG_00429 [Meyerozyma guilliermondii ATCC 6260]|uniref:Lysophospholipid acyltransferase n=1 Tax=Meyerozyma guilliermondii (strain ATCC 6260 / CBS 566 / DSM 6381 / JCM 1539 / NBRC 10279 / NRRL Y-324) TaxID=294746 RepID=A5DAX4_PICGU|nr:uncharacterized protein PGUG_00429 [Meyerozyma guilliermondii ATCC 6260]EDK36331.2 hypothetical protein PGUG_00429 [Meyerozyma guilliermondii ATCC 6260]
MAPHSSARLQLNRGEINLFLTDRNMGLQLLLHLASEKVGIEEANFKVLLCSLLSFPFSVIFKRLPDDQYTLKNVYIIGVSCFYIFGILELYSGLRTLLISSMGCYFITRYLRTSSMPWVNFVFLMGHLAYNHLQAQFFATYDPTKIDILGAQMVLVMKLSAFGWNVYDGKAPKSTLSEFGRLQAVRQHPDLLSYLGFVFFYASLLTGPSFHYNDYDRFIKSILFDDVPESKRPGRRVKRRIPRSGIPALFKASQGFMWAYLFIISPKFVTVEYLLSGDLVKEHGFVYRSVYLWILGFSYRLKYYTIWSIAEAACILCGIGYNGYDSATDSFKWNRVQNIDPVAFETGQNVHVCLESWNMNTNKWLKNYVYARVARPGKKPGFKSTVFTFVTSAFWHGTRPGYYLTFIMGAFSQTVGKIYRRNFRPMFVESDGKTPRGAKWLYDVVCFFVTQLTFGFICQPFMILDLKNSLYCWSTVYFFVPIGMAVTLFVFKGPYAKSVTAWCQQYHSKPKDVKPKHKLTKEESERVSTAVGALLEKNETDLAEAPSLGLPSIEVLQDVDRHEIDEELKELGQAWKSFRSRRGSVTEDDFEGLRDAYNNFTSEINEIFSSKREEKKGSGSESKKSV